MRSHSSLFGAAAVIAIAGAMALATTPAIAAPAHYSAGISHSSAAPAATKTGATEPVNRLSNPKATLVSAKVKDSTGHAVGKVKGVMTGKSGKAMKIDVALLARTGAAAKNVSIRASELRYDPASHTVMAELTSAEIRAMPKAAPEVTDP